LLHYFHTKQQYRISHKTRTKATGWIFFIQAPGGRLAIFYPSQNFLQKQEETSAMDMAFGTKNEEEQ
ncbi:MAG: hypothetical protein V1782_01005, partial [Pseudomonadota bacterium]